MGLPGTKFGVSHDSKCDIHPDRSAVIAIQGETDSFGYELHHMCSECYNYHKESEPTKGTCDSCKSDNVELVPFRDYEEGFNGPIYWNCRPCDRRRSDAIREEYELESGYYLDSYDFDYDESGYTRSDSEYCNVCECHGGHMFDCPTLNHSDPRVIEGVEYTEED